MAYKEFSLVAPFNSSAFLKAEIRALLTKVDFFLVFFLFSSFLVAV